MPASSALLERFRRPGIPGLPKYAQLREALLSAIADGHWKPGAKLPTEQDLARSTPYSLGTVQRALRALVDEGIVVRLQGSGTYVAESRKPMDAPWHCRFLDDSGDGFLPVYARVVGRRLVPPGGPWSAHFGPESVDAIRIDRVININDEFNVYSQFYLDAERFGRMLTRPVAELDGVNLKIVISREFGLPVRHVAQTLSSVRFPEPVLRALKRRRAMTGTLLEIAASAARDRPVYYQELFIPPTRRRLVVSDSFDARA